MCRVSWRRGGSWSVLDLVVEGFPFQVLGSRVQISIALQVGVQHELSRYLLPFAKFILGQIFTVDFLIILMALFFAKKKITKLFFWPNIKHCIIT